MYVEINIPSVTGLSLTTKSKEDEGPVTTVSFQAALSVETQARLYNLLRQRAPLSVSVSSPQAQLDLQVLDIRDLKPTGVEKPKARSHKKKADPPADPPEDVLNKAPVSGDGKGEDPPFPTEEEEAAHLGASSEEDKEKAAI